MAKRARIEGDVEVQDHELILRVKLAPNPSDSSTAVVYQQTQDALKPPLGRDIVAKIKANQIPRHASRADMIASEVCSLVNSYQMRKGFVKGQHGI